MADSPPKKKLRPDDVLPLSLFHSADEALAYADFVASARSLPIASICASWGVAVDPNDPPSAHRRVLVEELRSDFARVARKKLPNVNTLDDVVALIQTAASVVVLTGAGISVAAGIPDFRSADGVYARVKAQLGLDSPQDIFDISKFRCATPLLALPPPPPPRAQGLIRRRSTPLRRRFGAPTLPPRSRIILCARCRTLTSCGAVTRRTSTRSTQQPG
jgi:hypothetical protein